MKLRISTLLVLGGTAAALSFSSLPAKETPSPEAAQKLAKALQGRTPGQPVPCIANLRGRAQMSVIDDTTILFREGSTVYVQKPNGGCPRLGNGRYALVKRQVGSTRLLRGRYRRGRRSRLRILCGKLHFRPVRSLSEGGAMNLRAAVSFGLTALVIASCTSTPAQEIRSPRAQKELTEALAGRTPARRSIASRTGDDRHAGHRRLYHTVPGRHAPSMSRIREVDATA